MSVSAHKDQAVTQRPRYNVLISRCKARPSPLSLPAVPCLSSTRCVARAAAAAAVVVVVAGGHLACSHLSQSFSHTLGWVSGLWFTTVRESWLERAAVVVL